MCVNFRSVWRAQGDFSLFSHIQKCRSRRARDRLQAHVAGPNELDYLLQAIGFRRQGTQPNPGLTGEVGCHFVLGGEVPMAGIGQDKIEGRELGLDGQGQPAPAVITDEDRFVKRAGAEVIQKRPPADYFLGARAKSKHLGYERAIHPAR
ncbi:MAG: hypothetical protein FJW35_07780 [Acidobacteria bacterium]|nr:hypothetical protein [Acidobacteriota bacterium]